MLGMPSNSAIKAGLYAKNIDFRKKKCTVYTSWIRTCNFLNVSQLFYPLRYMAVVFEGMLLEFSPLFRLQATAERKLITALPRGDKLEVGG